MIFCLFKEYPFKEFCNFRISKSVKFRCSDHALLIEVGGHKGLQVEQRLYKMCHLNLVEDEFHFLTICLAYDNLRAVLLSAANVMLLDPEIQFSTIMRSENTIVIRRLAEFIMNAKCEQTEGFT